MLYVQPDSQPGRCSSCGFLANGIDTARTGFGEASPFERENGGGILVRCLLFAANLGEEMDRQPKGWAMDERTKAVLSFDRQCPEWYQYKLGLTPEGHRQERDVLRLEQDRREHDRKLVEMQIGVQKDSLKIAEALVETARRTDRFTTRWTKAAFTLAAIGVALVALAYLFPDLGRHVGEAIVRALGYPLGR